jgi:plastocyanin
MKPPAIGAALALVCALVLVISQAAPASSGPARASSGSAVTVDISHFKFHPPTVRIRKGTKVVFSNSSPIAHTATRKGSFDTGRIKSGHSVAVRFKQSGTFAYVCKIHPFMHGKIVVH